ncbi:MAG: adenylate kinase [Chloroflexi bacterium CG15_BIG_FIL_POST_REV_8_21_14_020_46_15]|nr:MAG: adenylate kinase [Chloroflexi bacterium CG15_BIG_FIL_POST_REV_8_21_14_020_46_15]
MYIILLGAPGAGKGTQADRLSSELNLPHIASGDLFREALSKETELGLLAKSYMERGELVPDEVTIKMILQRIEMPDCVSGCLFDGFPRTLAQAEALDKGLADKGKNIDKVLYIKVSNEELLKRLGGRWLCQNCQTPYHLITAPPKVPGKCDKCGGELYQREDDKEETVKERLRVFFAQTIPIVDYYRGQSKLIEVNGNQGIQEVAKKIMLSLRKAR